MISSSGARHDREDSTIGVHPEDEATIVVEEVYEEDVDGEMEELLAVENPQHGIRYEEEEEQTDGDGYGGMPLETYNSIVKYKRTGAYPPTINSRQDRSALSHWRSRCNKFVLADDNETLLYYNPASPVNDQPKVVVKKGEARRVVERIHELIGHLGQKRTQMVVLKKLHWRSVRQDVKTCILNCNFCNQKKLEGKKILKAPVDISSEHFGINIEVRSKAPEDGSGMERLTFSLVGYNEQDVQAAAMSRMTTYTFKETAPDLRGGRYRLPKTDYMTSLSGFRRQPYIKRSRFGTYPTSYMLPYTPKANREPEFIIYPDPRNPANGYDVSHDEYGVIEEQVVETEEEPSTSRRNEESVQMEGQTEGVMMEQVVTEETISPQRTETPLADHIKTEPVTVTTEPHTHMNMYYQPRSPKRDVARSPVQHPVEMPRMSGTVRRRKRKYANTPGGVASRYSMAAGDLDRIDLNQNTSELLTPLDAAQYRPEMIGIAPIMLMPSSDPEVTQLQKELLNRQLRIQELQEKVLHSQFESMRIPIARYEEIDPSGDRMQLIGHGEEEEVLEEGVEMDQELNVMDSGDEDDDIDVMKRYGPD